MTHKAYTTIENYYNEDYVEQIKINFKDNIFIAQEKIHGCNFSFQISYNSLNKDYNKILCSSRNQTIGILTSNDAPDLFGTKKILINKYNDLYKLKHNICNFLDNVDAAQIYGELFGGFYNHRLVKKIADVKPIQKGINYTQHNDFIIFDIRIQTTDNSDFYISQEEISNLIKDTKLKQLKILHYNKLEELLKLEPIFESTIYNYYNLPKIDNNYAEGYVLKKSGRIYIDRLIPIIKIKSSFFSEICNIKPEINIELNNKIKFIEDNYINKNRIETFKSKNIDASNKFLICGIIDDVVDEYLKLNKEELYTRELLIEKIRKVSSKKIIKLI